MDDKQKTSQTFLVKFLPTTEVGTKTSRAQAKVKPFQEDIRNAGLIEKDLDLTRIILEQKSLGELPEAFQGIQAAEITLAGKLHSKGIEATDVFNKTYESKILNAKQKVQLYTAGFVMSAMEDLDQEMFSYFQEANLYPEIQFEVAPPQMQSAPPNQLLLSSKNDLLTPVIEEVKGRAAAMAKQKVKKFATKALKKGGKKIAKSLLKKAAKKGVQLAVKAGMRAAVLSAEAAATGLTGGLALIVIAAAEILSKIKKKLGKYVSKFFTKITGDPEFTKRLRYVAIGVIGLSLLGNFAIPAAGIAIIVMMGVLVGVTAIISSIAIPILVTFFSIGLFVGFVLIIVNSGAYLVPEGGFETSGVTTQSPYISVEKTVDNPGPYNNNQNITVTYTITVRAIRGTLTSISFNYTCDVNKENSNVSCPAVRNITVNGTPQALNTFPPPAPTEIIGIADYVITYEVLYPNTDGRYNDSLITDTFSVQATTDSTMSSALGIASIIIGDPPTGCMEAAGNWRSDYLSNIQSAITRLATQHPAYIAKVCANGQMIPICSAPPYGSYWGEHVHGADCDIYIRPNGLRSASDATYILAHELGHHLSSIDGRWVSSYLDSGATSELPLCTYGSGVSEGFAEGIALYVQTPSYYSDVCFGSYQTLYPLHYNFIQNTIF